jgi:uncharacterized protein (DUF2147 family)
MKMKFGLFLGIVAVAIFTTSSLWAADPIVGKWKTIDDETKQVKSIVEIYAQDGKIFGKVLQVLIAKDKGKVCDKCEGANKGKPVEGMVIVKNMKDDGSQWADGTILDPAKGKEYKCKMKAIEGGNKLEVKGCISFLCRTQIWVKAK